MTIRLQINSWESPSCTDSGTSIIMVCSVHACAGALIALRARSTVLKCAWWHFVVFVNRWGSIALSMECDHRFEIFSFSLLIAVDSGAFDAICSVAETLFRMLPFRADDECQNLFWLKLKLCRASVIRSRSGRLAQSVTEFLDVFGPQLLDVQIG